MAVIIPTLPELIKFEWVAQAAFYFIIGVTLAGAVSAVFLRRIIHNILGLIVALFGVAGLFIYLNSEFLALMQILIYVGAICISIVFAIMLSDPMYKEDPRRRLTKVFASVLVSLLILAGFLSMITKTPFEAAAQRSDDWTVTTVGNLLLTRYALVFELISFVLVVAIIGAIVIAGQGRKQRSLK
ncbi:MAG: NADH-quinone oxidoreductase subunit J [Deltaproteobacteria bacterium]|nr:NADH-quinone oxidoreductase subunit J [Deltaproteobacteria bacterium]MBW2051402.1 NADH-quinone oxidoreductase subunit J [Deltaproteobacteria bacterium]MBW2140038.1 NADH-quinone oxidoreductase subunit J [Deltaproteobacteria bacterium]MBW2321917.1 NADH-quinone oxidoreductase subunit J [Deltaproteobacteria bacterium]